MIIESEQEIMTEKEKNCFKKNWKKNSEKVLKIIIKDRDLMALQAIIEGQKEEIEKLQEECTYMTQKAYDFFSALFDIKHYIDNEWCWDGTGIDIIENIVEEALEKDMITKEDIKKLKGE